MALGQHATPIANDQGKCAWVSRPLNGYKA